MIADGPVAQPGQSGGQSVVSLRIIKLTKNKQDGLAEAPDHYGFVDPARGMK